MSLLHRLRHHLVAVKDRIDARLHPGRRRAARERLAELAPSSVLFICLGNVCRSPYGERVLAAMADRGITVESAGFIGPGREPPDMALHVARERGVDHADHRSRVVTDEMLDRVQAVIFFDRFNLARLRRTTGVDVDRLFWLGDFDPEWGGKRSIPDPWGKPEEEFRRTFQRIERCLAEVEAVLRENRGGGAGDDAGA